MNRTERALEAVSKAVREATWAFEREMLGRTTGILSSRASGTAVGVSSTSA
jgi:hypothetical protein